MSLKDEILGTLPTSYWPLDDPPPAATATDLKGLHNGTISTTGVTLGVVPFGTSMMPYFDGKKNSAITIPDDDCYSHTSTGLLTVACWICPMVLNFEFTGGSEPTEQYVHLIQKAVKHNKDVEWAFRLLNANSLKKPSRLSFYLFKLGLNPGKGAGAYMQYGLSVNDSFLVEVGRWLFLVGQGEKWIDDTDQTTGAVLFKQGVQAERSRGDKYNNPPKWNVQPKNGSGDITIGGSIGESWFRGAIAHVALWNRLLAPSEVIGIWSQGLAELRATPMYCSY